MQTFTYFIRLMLSPLADNKTKHMKMVTTRTTAQAHPIAIPITAAFVKPASASE